MIKTVLQVLCICLGETLVVSKHPPHNKHTQTHTHFSWRRGWSGVVNVSCILRHQGVQLILAYSWERSAFLVAGKGRGGMFLSLLFLRFPSYSSFFPIPLFHLLYYLFYLFYPALWETIQNDLQGLTCH